MGESDSSQRGDLARPTPRYPARKASKDAVSSPATVGPSAADPESTFLILKVIASGIAAFVLALAMHATPNHPDLPRIFGYSILYSLPIFSVFQLIEAVVKQRYYSRSTLVSTIVLAITHLCYVVEYDRANASIHLAGLGVVVFLVGVFAIVDGLRAPRD